MDDYLEAMADDMKGVLDALASALVKIRTGRASPKLVDTIPVLVAAYGSSMPLNQLCTVNAPDARLLVLTPAVMVRSYVFPFHRSPPSAAAT